MNHIKGIISYLLMLPAILIGIYTMVCYDVPRSIWVQNIIIWIIGFLIGSIFISRSRVKYKMGVHSRQTIIIVILLVLPFFFSGIDGIHRWVTVGPINIYITSIILPVLIFYIWKIAINNRQRNVLVLTFITLLILLLQPDAGQLSAFASATAIIFWKMIRSKTIKIISIATILLFVMVSWVFLDDLEPVSYVEDIIFLVAGLGNVWLIAGILSLVLLFIPFFIYGKNNVISYSLGVYYFTMMIVTFIGNFPLPIMGYGISPIIGYFIAISLLHKDNLVRL